MHTFTARRSGWLVCSSLLLSGCVGDTQDPAPSSPDPLNETPQNRAPAVTPTTPSTTPAVVPDNGEADANTLTLYAIPAPTSASNPRGVNWDSPGDLVRTGLMNEAQGLSRAIGHVAVNVQCAETSLLPAAHYMSGMTNVSQSEFKDLLLKDQVGLGMLFENVRGELETEARVRSTVSERTASGAMSFLRFQVSAEVCRGLLDYAEAFKRAGVYKKYGLAARPLFKEGAGCSAYGLSYMQLANLVEPRFTAAWSFDVRVPKWLAGTTRTPLVGGVMNPSAKVPVARLTSLSQPWATAIEDGYNLFGWDPTLMHNWILKRSEAARVDGSEKVDTLGKAQGLVLDRRTVVPSDALINKAYFQMP